MEKKYNDDELFVELNKAIEELEREAASKTVFKKKTYIHCKREGHLLLTIPVTVEEDQLSSSTISLWTYLSRGICLLFFLFFCLLI